MYYMGTSVFSIQGFEVFDVTEFPFDRQLLDLGLMEFVWRREKDMDTFEESMKVVSLSLETWSMLPQWRPSAAVLKPLDEVLELAQDGTRTPLKPIHCSRFRVKLRASRRMRYYQIQIILLTSLILVSSLLPLGMKADNLADRMAVLAGGLLALTAFKFSIAEELPSVPYSTFMDMYLLMQVVTICAVMGWVTVEYKFTPPENLERFRWISDGLFFIIVSVWIVATVYTFIRKRRSWQAIMEARGEHISERHISQREDDP
jgi:hypothetical protein